MAVGQRVEPVGSGGPDPVAARPADLVLELGRLVTVDQPAGDAARVDRIALLERLRAVTAAVQAAECVRFAKSQTADQMAQGVHPRAVGRGVADQIALACRVSPPVGSARLAVARALWHDLPGVYGLLTAGEVSERVAEQVVTETRHLDAGTRRQVDTQLVAAGISGLGCGRRPAPPAGWPTPPTRRGTWRGAGPSAGTGGSGSGPPLTPWRC